MKRKFSYLLMFLILGAFFFGFANELKKGSSLGVSANNSPSHYRIYAINNVKWNGDGDPLMFIHYEAGDNSSSKEDSPEMIKVLNNYYNGLFYYDVPGNTTEFLIKNWKDDNREAWDQSRAIHIDELFTEDESPYKAIRIEPDPTIQEQGPNLYKRRVEILETVPASNVELAEILSYIDSCSPNPAGGYNAWPQLDQLFIKPSANDNPSEVVKDKFGDDTILEHKIAHLENMYNTVGFGSLLASGKHYEKNDSSLAATIIIGVIGITTLAGYYFITKKSGLKV